MGGIKHYRLRTFMVMRRYLYKNKTIENMEALHWPKEFTPGFTDNFVSAETYVAGLTAEEECNL